MRQVILYLTGLGLLASLVFPNAAMADAIYYHNGYALGVGANIASENDAREEFAISFKYRSYHWQYGIDHCTSAGAGDIGTTEYQFLWVSYIEEFKRPADSDYGIYAGLGGGGFLGLEDDFLENPFGPFLLVGWDMSDWIGLEGKVGTFGRNYWASALIYWYL